VLDQPVCPVGETSGSLFGLLFLAEHHVFHLFQQTGVIHDVVGIDAVLFKHIPHGADAAGRRPGTVQSAVGVEQQVIIFAALGDQFGGLLCIALGAPVAAIFMKPAIVYVDEMAGDLSPGRCASQLLRIIQQG